MNEVLPELLGPNINIDLPRIFFLSNENSQVYFDVYYYNDYTYYAYYAYYVYYVYYYVY